ncbi:hypothetical protein ACR77V_12675, partial [Staphylococcus epidermidis]|uniref:hypothetical protein n=1 Tax=Staphylococcus epidermidis TaxID=1282 RepID=UPI003DA38259
MLYSVLTLILAIYAVATPFIYKEAVKFGVKLAEKPAEVAEEPVFNTQKRKSEKSFEAEEELRKRQIEWENLEN